MSGSVNASLLTVPEDHLTTLLAEALRDLVLFVENRPDDATPDDDVRALEDFAHVPESGYARRHGAGEASAGR